MSECIGDWRGAGGADDELHPWFVILKQRSIEERLRIFTQAFILARLDDADDLRASAGVVGSLDADGLTNRILVRPESLGHLITDHDDRRSRHIVSLLEAASTEDGNPHCLEIVRSHERHVDREPGLAGWSTLCLVAIDLDSLHSRDLTERQMIRQARITDARHRANLFKEASVESSAAGFVVAKCVHIQSGRNCIARVESGIDRARVEETPQTQA